MACAVAVRMSADLPESRADSFVSSRRRAMASADPTPQREPDHDGTGLARKRLLRLVVTRRGLMPEHVPTGTVQPACAPPGSGRR